MQERIRFYDQRVRESVERLRPSSSSPRSRAWREAKLPFIGLLVEHNRPELAETFFNSVITRVLGRTY